MDEHDRIINWLTRRTADEMEVAAAEAITKLRAELTECREVLKQLYNVTLFDYDLMPEFYRKEAHQIVRETVRDALVAKGE